MPAIQAIQAREILDSQGFPTIEVELWLDNGMRVESSAPNGGDQDPHQKSPKYDKNPDHMAGRGVQEAVKLINNTIAPQLIKKDPTQQEQLDQLLGQIDQSENKEQIGSNTLTALSQAIAKAGAAASGLPLYEYLSQKYKLTEFLKIPTCMYGLINGGKYGTNNLDIQEFLVIPASHVDYRVSLEIETAIREELKNILKDRKASYSTGTLGGFTPHLQKNSNALEFIVDASRKTPYILSRDFFLGIDVGGQNLDRRGKYYFRDKSTLFTHSELMEFYKGLKQQYNLIYIEDPFSTKDEKPWQNLTAEIGATTKISSDVFTSTQLKRTNQAIKERVANAIVIKPSQSGSISETISIIKIAKANNWQVIVSQRAGETNDSFLADFAVGIGADFVKFGPTSRGEMVAKYNRFAKIYVELINKNNNKEPVMMDDTNQTTNPAADQTADDQATTQDAVETPEVATDPDQAKATPAPVTPPPSLAEAVPEIGAVPTPVTPPTVPAVETPVVPEVNPLTPAGAEDSEETPTETPAPTTVMPTPTEPVTASTAASTPEETGGLVGSAQEAIKSSLDQIEATPPVVETPTVPAPAIPEPTPVVAPVEATATETEVNPTETT